jgi:predicted DNA-binding transcriptional regulator AlpA
MDAHARPALALTVRIELADGDLDALADRLAQRLAETLPPHHAAAGAPEPMLSLAQVLPYSGVGKSTLEKLAASGCVPRHRLGGRSFGYLASEVSEAARRGFPVIKLDTGRRRRGTR